jgi:hypothetical protein
MGLAPVFPKTFRRPQAVHEKQRLDLIHHLAAVPLHLIAGASQLAVRSLFRRKYMYSAQETTSQERCQFLSITPVSFDTSANLRNQGGWRNHGVEPGRQ